MANATAKKPVKSKKLKSLKSFNKLSDLLAVALKEISKCERLKNVKVNMSTWFTTNGKCEVCLAGSVMRGCLQRPHKDDWGGEYEYYPEDYDLDTAHKLDALDRLRCGFVGTAAMLTHKNYAKASWVESDALREQYTHLDRNVSGYGTTKSTREKWHEDMKKLLADLRKAGL